MTMIFCVKPEQLRKALAEIEQAERNGFHYCQAVFRMASAGRMLSQCQAEYSDLSESAHPTDPSLDWGRYQSVTKRNIFVDGKLLSIEAAPIRTCQCENPVWEDGPGELARCKVCGLCD